MIATRGLSVRFAGEARIRYGDLTFEDGASYALLGASGCGKTTLLNILAGVLTPDAGEVWIGGRDMAGASPREKDDFRVRNIGFIFQDFKLIEDMTVEDNLRLLELERVDVSGMDDVLASLGILPFKRRRVRKLSGGEKQRVAIARALVKRPALILADEPTGNLNYEIGRRIVEELLGVSKGKTLIAVTHDDRLAGMFDHVIDVNEFARVEVDNNA